jgi:glutamate synthase domain-containing protein 1
MCVIIVNKNKTISEELLTLASGCNPHGAGMMWHADNRLHIFKNVINEKVIERYYNLRKEFDGTIVLHFRVATHGRIDFDNTHPIRINKNTAIVHNGIIAGYGNSRFSDTYMFAKEIDVTQLGNQSYLLYLQRLIGSSRVVITHNGNLIILNRHLFREYKGDLYSNLYFLYPLYPARKAAPAIDE